MTTAKKDRDTTETQQCRKGGRVTVPAEKSTTAPAKSADSKGEKPTRGKDHGTA